ncbi:hypothetical protein IID24_05490 [Patescibacteria group bacterium]|nr:hypothetical protein [Patescibacteria group bacterium]
MFKNPWKARDIHIHKFTPKKMRELTQGTALEYVQSNFSFLSIPQFFTVLRKQA